MNKKLSIILCACVMPLAMPAQTVCAQEAILNDASTNAFSDTVAEELGGEAISVDEIPSNVIPIEFETIEEAKEFLAEQEELTQQTISNDSFNAVDSVFTLDTTRARTTSGVKTQVIYTGTCNINIYANYQCANKKFTKCTGVKSTLTGLTTGIKWTQDNYSASIPTTGKKLYVTVYGHYDYYILIKTTYTHVGSKDEKYGAAWDL